MANDNKNEHQIFTRVNAHQLNQLEQLRVSKQHSSG